MHRMTPGWRRKAFGLAALLAAGVMLSACAHENPTLPDQDTPYVEMLRMRISKVRQAIRDTREAIARSRGAPYRPELYVRLAELMSEEARYHYEVAYERDQRASKILHAPQVRFLKERAVATYQKVLKDYPDTPLADRILFNIGHEQRELGKYEDMIKTLDRLIEQHTDSPLRPEALLVLGDYYFDKNDMDNAARYYERIATGGLTRVSGLSLYKMGWVWVNRADCKKAVLSFDQAITVTGKWEAAKREAAADEGPKRRVATLEGQARGGEDAVSSARQDIDVRREALVDLIYCFARVNKPENALPFVQQRAYNRAAYIAALERMASRYSGLNQAVGVRDATRELLALAPSSPDRLDDARLLYASVKQLGKYERVGDDIRLMARAMRRETAKVAMDDETRDLTVNEFEQYARDMATKAHARLEEGKLPAERAAEVAGGYQAYIDAFPFSEHRGDILLNLSEVLGKTGESFAAGQRALEAAQLLEDEEERKGALYDAVVFFQQSFEKARERSLIERVAARVALRKAAGELLRHQLDEEKSVSVKFALAQTYYDEGSYREAIDRLTALAYEYPKAKESRAAIHLVMDSLNTLNDYEGMISAGNRFLGPGSPADESLKAELRPIVAAAGERKIDELSLAAAGSEGGDLEPLKEFAARNSGTEVGERALLNAFVAARAMGDSDQLYELGAELSTVYPKSDQLAGVQATMAKNAVATFDFDKAMEFFESAARTDEEQRVALFTAMGDIKVQLGDTNAALRYYRQALDAAADTNAKGLPAGRMARVLERMGNDRQTIELLAPLAETGNPEVLSRLGLARLRQGQGEEAETLLQQVIDGSVEASPEAGARAQYGMAEALALAFRGMPNPTTLEGVEEFMLMLEVTEQGYLAAIRQGDPIFAAAALARLAYLSEETAGRLEQLRPPTDLEPEAVSAFREGLTARVAQLRQNAEAAEAACVNQAWSNHVFNTPVRGCLAGRKAASDPVKFEPLQPRRAAQAPKELEEARGRLARNPNDLAVLRDVGIAFMKVGDPHMARLAFQRAVENGGGTEDLNRLGEALFEIGDFDAALEAFFQAGEGGLGAARANMVRSLKKLGLSEAARKVGERWQQ